MKSGSRLTAAMLVSSNGRRLRTKQRLTLYATDSSLETATA